QHPASSRGFVSGSTQLCPSWPTSLAAEDALDHLAHGPTTAGSVGDVVGGPPYLWAGVGNSHRQPAPQQHRHVGRVITHKSDLFRVNPLAPQAAPKGRPLGGHPPGGWVHPPPLLPAPRRPAPSPRPRGRCVSPPPATPSAPSRHGRGTASTQSPHRRSRRTR